MMLKERLQMPRYSLKEAREAGRHYGHTAANWQEAQTSLPIPDPQVEGARLASEQISYDEAAWTEGFVEGWELRMEGFYEDGTLMDEDGDFE
jgi:hypothetical protein